MTEIFLEKVLRDINYPISDSNKIFINSVLANSTQDIKYIWTKIPSLLEKLKHVKGYVGVSNNDNKIKISFDKDSVSEEIAMEFFNIVNNWANKYKISLFFDYDKESFYIK
jgi:hypothetical protein